LKKTAVGGTQRPADSQKTSSGISQMSRNGGGANDCLLAGQVRAASPLGPLDGRNSNYDSATAVLVSLRMAARAKEQSNSKPSCALTLKLLPSDKAAMSETDFAQALLLIDSGRLGQRPLRT